MTEPTDEEGAGKTPKFRSAPYPAIALSKAIERSTQMYEKALHHSVPINVPAEAWGYSVKSSGLFGAIAALKQYGLLLDEGSGGKRRFRLSNDALRIAKDPDPNSEKRRAAIHRAALAPPIYKEIWEKFGASAASGTMDMVIKTHLTLDRADSGLATYADKAADDIIDGFQKAILTSGLLASESVSTELGQTGEEIEETSDEGVTPPINVKIGDFIQWESRGALQFEKPRRVRWISKDESHIAVENSDTRIPVEQIILEVAPTATPVAPQSPPPQMPPILPPIPPTTLQFQEPAKEGLRKAVFPVSEGDVTFIFPEGMTLDGIEELEAYLAVFLKKEKRNAQAS